MKLEVMTGTKEEFEAAISRPEGEVTMANYMAYMQEQLEAAEAARQEPIILRRSPKPERP